MDNARTMAAARLCGISPRGEKAYLAATAALVLIYAIPLCLRVCGLEGFTFLLLREDGVYEDMGALLCLASAALLLAAYVRFPSTGGSCLKRRNVFLLLLALFMFFLFGEEISWGQRLLGLRTPDFMRDVNVQGEMTLHNLEWFQKPACNLLGDNATRLVNLYLVLVIPALAFPAFGRLLFLSRLPVASIRIAFMVIVNRVLHALAMGYVGGPKGAGDVNRMGEIFETNVELLLFLFALELYFSAGRSFRGEDAGEGSVTTAPPLPRTPS